MGISRGMFTVPISVSTLGDNAIASLAANGNRQLVIHNGFLKSGGNAVSWKIVTTGGSDVTAAVPLAAGEGGPINVPVIVPVGEGVEINLSAAESVVGWLNCEWD